LKKIGKTKSLMSISSMGEQGREKNSK